MNYNGFFGFSESPFPDVPDQRFFFLSKQHEALLEELADFVRARQGIAVVSGDEGVGKTMLVQALIQRLPASFQPLIISKPSLEPLAITLIIAGALDITLRETNLVKLTPFSDAVQSLAQQGKYLLVVLDDAHVLTDQHLEEIYILSQMEYQGQQLMSIVLVGRKGLVPKIASKANERLHKLVRLDLALTGLTFGETTLYIDHHLQQVGSSYKACFAEDCSGQIFSRTGGIPRRINQVCHQALNRAWQEQRHRVTRDLLGGEGPPSPFKPLAPPPRWISLKSYGIPAAGLLVASLAGYVLYNMYFGPAPSRTSPPVAATTAVTEKSVPAPPQVVSPPTAAVVPQPPPQDKPAAMSSGPQEAPPPPSPAPRGPEGAHGLVVADTSQVPPADNGMSEPETTKPATHQVAPEDGLLKIVASYYPDNKEIGYDAVILANPRITNEDIIFSGQSITLPGVDKRNNIIILDNKEHFAIFKRYYNASQAEKAEARLKELQLRYMVRETQLPDDNKIYRIFLGGYGSKEELKKAMALAEKN